MSDAIDVAHTHVLALIFNLKLLLAVINGCSLPS